MDLRNASLNSITVRQAPLSTLLDLAAAEGFGQVALWRECYQELGAARAATEVRRRGLRVSSVCRGGMFVQRTAEQRRRQADDNRAAVDEAAELDAACLVLVCGGVDGTDIRGARAQIRDGIAALAPYAAAAGMPLAIEPMHPMMAADRSAITSLGEANHLAEDLDVHIALDAYHVWWDASLGEEIHRAAPRVVGVQVSDWVLPINDQLSSRGMPGTGAIDLDWFLSCVTETGFGGPIEVEVLSAACWRRPPEVVVREAADAMASLPYLTEQP